MEPTQCHLWQKENITSKDLDWEIIKTYWDRSHEWRRLVSCKKCGQLYISDTVEFVNWGGGDDEIYTIIIPISKEELGNYDFEKLSPIELLQFSPRILWGCDYSVRWIGKNNSE